MWGMDAVTGIELESERRREVLLGDAGRRSRVAAEEREVRKVSMVKRATALIAQVLPIRLLATRM